MKRIQDLPHIDRPREKLQHKGAKALSDLELLAVILGSGSQKQSVMALAASILKILDQTNTRARFEDFTGIEGIGPAKAARLTATMEFTRRRIRPQGFKITFAPDVYPLIRHMADRKQEHFICISLNGANEVINIRTVSVGLVNRALIHPREVYADPITDRASAVIVAHNHPSGSMTPSTDDIAVTRQLQKAGQTLGIKLLDHIIFSQENYYSFLEHKQL